MADVIITDNVVKHYGPVRAVDGVDLAISPGEFFGILGPNGAGKTTILELIEGVRKPDSGQITVLGCRPWPRNGTLLPRIGVQLQAAAFFERLTVREQLTAFAELYQANLNRVDLMIDMVGLADKATTRTEKLSGGQQQRLSIACALVHDPEVVFLDEPTAALDPQARRNLWDVLREINASGRTVVLTTHYMDEAESLCDRVAIMDAGRVLTVDTPAALVRNLAAPTHISLPDRTLTVDQARHIAGVGEVTTSNGTVTLVTEQPATVLLALAQRAALEGLSVTGARLEDVFLSLTGRAYRA